MSNPIFCALDVPGVDEALSLGRRIAPHVGGLKLGLEFFCAVGPEGIRRVAEEAGLPIFLDLKFHDIPNTVAGAVRSVMALKPAILTVHATGGRAMLEAAGNAAREEAARLGCEPPKVVAVTVLTSMDAGDLNAVGVAASPADQVARLADLVRASGLDGTVCSPREVAAVKAAWPEAFTVVPGIRPTGSAVGDQKRVMGPQEALEAGASVLVIGRPITEAADPAAAAEAIAAGIGAQSVTR
ncbi:MAG TPA: orotidine-5'-phosphate decarboxylase [Pedomonas sp.]|nr:orotidine-5'-phosphate decarboxylase [Pedomonas sp.]